MLLAAAGVAVAGLSLLVAQYLRVQHAAEADRRAVAQTAEDLTRKVAEADAATAAVARRLAELKVVRAAVETDADTVRDLAQNDPTFRFAPSEVLELLQIRDRQESLLIRVPANAPPLPSRGGAATRPDGSVWVTARAPVAPLYGQSPGSGAVLLSHRVEVAGLALEGARIGPAQEAPRGARVLPIGDSADLALIAPPPAGAGRALGNLGLFCVALGFLSGAGMIVRSWRRPAMAPSPVPLPAMEPPPRSAPVEISDVQRVLGGRYRTFRELGAGAHGRVYLALSFQRPGVAEEVALKVWRRVGDAAAAGFLDGAAAVRCVSHPNLVRVLDFGAQDNAAWLAMEYVDGWSLADLLTELRKTDERMPLRHVLTIGVSLCRGLHAAHTAVDANARPLRLVHGAIKPSNVLIGRDGTVKLGDFARSSPRPETPSAAADHLAPEQVAGKVVDERADVYALAALLHELASGSHVHFALPGPHAADRRAFARPRLRELRGDVPPRLDAAISRALEFAPTDRFGSCREFLRELDAVLEADLDGTQPGVLGDWAEGVRHLSRVVVSVSRKS
jgi:hypothetical protein